MYDGSVRRSMGSCLLTVRDKEGLLRWLYFEVLDIKQHSLLSLDSCLNLHLLQYIVEDVHLTGENHVTREWIVREFPDLFQGIGCLPGEYDIELEEGVSPVQNRPRKILHVMKAAVEEKLKSLEEYGVIARVDTPTPWINNLTTVWKADKK